MKTKSLVLLLVFVTSLFPLYPGQAESSEYRSLEDATALMYLSDALLLEESELDSAASLPGLFSYNYSVSPATPAENMMNRMIHAAKMERNDLDANCQLLVSRFSSEGNGCEVKKVQSHCDQVRTKLNNRISLLRKLRGDRRKPLTKMWHSIKRGSANFWHRIGPLGRNFLRQIGPETLKIVVSGGSLSGGVLKNLIKQVAKSVGRQHLKQVVYQGVERMLMGQIQIAQAAGVDLCAEEVQEEVTTTKEDKKEEEDCSADTGWVNAYWDEVVFASLVEENRNCQIRAANIYRSCLQDQAINGVCQEDAVDACDQAYQSIPKNDAGGSVSLSPDVVHGDAESVSTSLTYPSAGGAVSGEFFYILKDDTQKCTITIRGTISSGNYNPVTCSMSGTASLTSIYEGIACPGVCGPSTGDCPKTIQGNVPWEADLENNVLSGAMGCNAGDPGCIGFITGQ
jgi:hypothetical protein